MPVPTASRLVRLDAFVGLRRDESVVGKLLKTEGRFPWGYEVVVNGEPVTTGPNPMLEVMYGQETIESAGQRLLDLAEAALEILKDPSNQDLQPTPVVH